MNNRKYQNLVKSLFGYKKGIWLLFISVSIAFNILMVYQINEYSNNINEVNKAKILYGRYDIQTYYTDTPLPADVTEDGKVKSSLSVPVYFHNDPYEELIFKYMYTTEYDKFFDLSEYSLVEGGYPESEDEILIEKWYLIKSGIKSEDMIGHRISLYNPQSKRFENKRISGLIQLNDLNTDISGHMDAPHVVFGSTAYKDAEYQTYIELKDIDDTDKFAEYVKEYVDENNDQVECNYHALELTQEANLNNNDIVIIVVLGLMLILIVSNVIRMFVKKNVDILFVYKITGTDMTSISLVINIMLTTIVCLSAIVGCIFAVLELNILGDISFKLFDIGTSAQIIVPYKKILVQLVALGIISSFYTFIYLENYSNKTPLEMQESAHILKMSAKKRMTMYDDKLFKRTKMALRNIRVNLFQKITMTASVSFSICLLVLMLNKSNELTVYEDNNDKYPYRMDFNLDVSPEARENSRKVYEDITKVFKKLDISMYICDRNMKSVEFGWEQLEKIQPEEGQVHPIYSGVTHLDGYNYIDIIYMPYSDEVFDELCVEAGLDPKDVGDNEVIALNRTISRDNTKINKINLLGETINLSKLRSDNENEEDSLSSHKIRQFKVVGEVDELPVYPLIDVNAACIIMREKVYFDNYSFYQFPECIYIDTESPDDLNELARCINGVAGMAIKDQSEEYEQVQKNYKQSVFMYLSIFVLCIVSVVINLLLINDMEIFTKKKHICMELILGIRRLDCCIIYIIETTIIYAFGILMGYVGVKMIDNIFIEETVIFSEIDNIVLITKICVASLVGCILIMTLFIKKSIGAIKFPQDLEG